MLQKEYMYFTCIQYYVIAHRILPNYIVQVTYKTHKCIHFLKAEWIYTVNYSLLMKTHQSCQLWLKQQNVRQLKPQLFKRKKVCWNKCPVLAAKADHVIKQEKNSEGSLSHCQTMTSMSEFHSRCQPRCLHCTKITSKMFNALMWWLYPNSTKDELLQYMPAEWTAIDPIAHLTDTLRRGYQAAIYHHTHYSLFLWWYHLWVYIVNNI